MTRASTQALLGTTSLLSVAGPPAMAQHSGQEGNHEGAPRVGQADSAIKLAKCPVMGESINLAVAVETAHGPVYFCCQDCVSKYEGKPAKYAAMVNDQRTALADLPRIQVLCPVSRDPVDQEVFVESTGEKVYFCCKGCINKYQANPAKYASALANSYTYQTKCPVMGEDIDPQAFSTAGKGKRFYFCCKGCDKKFFRDPERYLPNLVAQGFSINTRDMIQQSSKKTGHADDTGTHDGHDHDHP